MTADKTKPLVCSRCSCSPCVEWCPSALAVSTIPDSFHPPHVRAMIEETRRKMSAEKARKGGDLQAD